MRDKSFDICSPDIQIRRLLLQKIAILGKNKQRQETSWEHENRIHQTNKKDYSTCNKLTSDSAICNQRNWSNWSDTA